MRLDVEIPENELKSLSAYLKKIGGNIIDQGNFTATELDSIKQGQKETPKKEKSKPGAESYNYF
jgi:hypothetical protein